MNTRSLIFVLILSAVLFFTNQWFSTGRQKKYAEELKQKEAVQTKKEASEDQETASRVAKERDLPLSHLYADLQGNAPLFGAISLGNDSYLTLSWDDKMPEEVFALKGKTFIPIYRVQGKKEKGTLVLYSAAQKPEILSAYLSPLGVQDLQLVSFIDPQSMNITLGEYENNRLRFPSDVPLNNAIALYKLEGKYFPVGLFDSDNERFIPFADMPQFKDVVAYYSETLTERISKKEELYVLQNDTLQLVFSNLGGAISEINLPFKKDSPKSVVLPVNFDRTIEKKYPSNARFPNEPYYLVEKDSVKPVAKKPVEGGFYPLLRRGIAKGTAYPPYKAPPRYYAFDVVSEDPETAQALYKVTQFNSEMIEFTASFPNRRIIKTFRLPPKNEKAPYCFFATVKVEGDSRGLWVTSGVPEVELISGSPAPIIKYSTVQNQKRVVEKLSLPKGSTTLSSAKPDWVANSNGYFALIMDPLSEVGIGFQANFVPGNLDPSRIVIIDSQHDLYPVNKYPGYEVHFPLPKSSQPLTFRLYTGPLENNVLKQVDATYTNQVTGYTPRYVDTQSFHGWFSFISEPFAKFLFLIMSFFYTITHSWGFSIILLTVVLRIILYPLNAWSIKSTLKLQEVSPKVQQLQEKYKKDPKRVQIEMMQLYKEHKVNPFGGCLPLIIQMPFLFGMFDLLKSTFSLRGASFIPGWINNLTAPDVLFSWSYPIPFIGTEFHLLPILIGIVMFFQQKFMNPKNKGAVLTDQQKQQQKMGSIMTIVMTVLFYKFPSGLNLYWLSSMLLQILQQWYTGKRKGLKLKNPKEIIVKPKKVK